LTWNFAYLRTTTVALVRKAAFRVIVWERMTVSMPVGSLVNIERTSLFRENVTGSTKCFVR